MNPPPPKEEVSMSHGKKSKAKQPDFEKTLVNWARNQQQKRGQAVSDNELKKQAFKLSFSRSDQALVSSTGWLEKFKQKNMLHGTAGDGGSVDSSTTSLIGTPVDGSPISSNGLVSPPISAADDARMTAIKGEQPHDFFDFDTKDYSGHSPMLQDITHELDTSSHGSMLSPISPEVSKGEELNMSEIMGDTTGITDAFSRQRRQTFAHLPEGISSRPASSGRKMPGLPVRSLTTTSEPRPTNIDPRQMMKRHKSVPDIHDPNNVRYSSMQPPPLPRSGDISPVSDPSSPLHDDNIRALHAIKTLLQQNPEVAEPDDYVMIGKLMEKLKVLRSPASNPTLPGGMHSIDIMDSPRLSRKRTILGIST